MPRPDEGANDANCRDLRGWHVRHQLAGQRGVVDVGPLLLRCYQDPRLALAVCCSRRSETDPSVDCLLTHR